MLYYLFFSYNTVYSVHCTMSMCILNIKKIMNIFSTFRKDEIGHTAQRYFATKKDPKTSFNHCSFSAVPIRIQFNKATNNFFFVGKNEPENTLGCTHFNIPPS